MPLLGRDIEMETEDIRRIENHIIQELKNLFAIIKRVMSERLENTRKLRELTEGRTLDWPQNRITESHYWLGHLWRTWVALKQHSSFQCHQHHKYLPCLWPKLPQCVLEVNMFCGSLCICPFMSITYYKPREMGKSKTCFELFLIQNCFFKWNLMQKSGIWNR